MEFKMTTINTDNFKVMPTGSMPVVRETTTPDTATLFNAVNGGSEPIKSVVDTGEPISVVNIVVTSTEINAERDNPDSEIVSVPVAHFFTTTGEHYSTLSNGIMRGVKMIFATGIVPTAEKPIELVFKSINTKKGTAHSFDIVGGV